MMPTKLIVCLLAACVVAGAGAYLYMDTGSCGTCPKSLQATSTGCPECQMASSESCCEGDTASCCSSPKMKVSCCADDVAVDSSKNSVAAGLGGAAAFATK
jgi:hypothetical protein